MPKILHKGYFKMLEIFIFVHTAQILTTIFVCFLSCCHLILQDLLRYNVLDKRTVC